MFCVQDGGSPLAVAAQYGHVDVCCFLLERGASVHQTMKVGSRFHASIIGLNIFDDISP